MKEIITVDEKNYELKYNEQVIETIETITGKGFMEILIDKKPVLSLADLKQYIANALYAEDGGKVPQIQGVKIYEALLHSKGYMFLNMLVIESIQRDCPFLPSQLVEFEYFGDNSGEVDESYNDLAKGYERDIDFAFFFVNFNTSKRDFMELTKREKVFIRKAWEEKEVRESTFLRNAVMNAVANAMRDKKTPFRDLWKKKQKPVDFEVVENNLDVVEESDKEDEFDWVAEIYKANGLNKPAEGGN